MPYAISGPEALAVVAKAPDLLDKSPADLREAAEEFEQDAFRKDRIAAGRTATGRMKGNRKLARLKKAERDAEQLRLHAMVVQQAADEVESRKALTVGEAVLANVSRPVKVLDVKGCE